MVYYNTNLHTFLICYRPLVKHPIFYSLSVKLKTCLVISQKLQQFWQKDDKTQGLSQCTKETMSISFFLLFCLDDGDYKAVNILHYTWRYDLGKNVLGHLVMLYRIITHNKCTFTLRFSDNVLSVAWTLL